MPNAINRQLMVKKNMTLCSRHHSGWASSFVRSPRKGLLRWKCQIVNLSVCCMLSVLPSLLQFICPMVKPSYCLLCLKCRCHGNTGRSLLNLSDVIQLHEPENPLIGARISAISLVQAELFYVIFRCHGNMGHPVVNLNYAVKLADPENHTIEPKITTLSCVQPELWQSKIFQNFPIGAIDFSDFFRIYQLNIQFKFSRG